MPTNKIRQMPNANARAAPGLVCAHREGEETPDRSKAQRVGWLPARQRRARGCNLIVGARRRKRLARNSPAGRLIEHVARKLGDVGETTSERPGSARTSSGWRAGKVVDPCAMPREAGGRLIGQMTGFASNGSPSIESTERVLSPKR